MPSGEHSVFSEKKERNVLLYLIYKKNVFNCIEIDEPLCEIIMTFSVILSGRHTNSSAANRDCRLLHHLLVHLKGSSFM